MGIPHYSNHPEGVAKVPCFNLDSIYRLDLAPTDILHFQQYRYKARDKHGLKRWSGMT